jgi:spermidine synthase
MRKIAPLTLERRLIIVMYFLSGAAALIYELIWVRVLTLEMGNTVFSVSTVVGTFMAGLAIGGYLGGLLSERYSPLKLYALFEGCIGLYALAWPGIIAWAGPVLLADLYNSPYYSFASFSFTRFILSFLSLILPTTLMGATFPILGKALVKDDRDIGSGVGLLYGINALGAGTGAFLAGFFLLPALGVSMTNYLAVFLNIGIMFSVLAFSWKEPLRNMSPVEKDTPLSLPFLPYRRLIPAVFFSRALPPWSTRWHGQGSYPSASAPLSMPSAS